jgi:hypothetical protein
MNKCSKSKIIIRKKPGSPRSGWLAQNRSPYHTLRKTYCLVKTTNMFPYKHTEQYIFVRSTRTYWIIPHKKTLNNFSTLHQMLPHRIASHPASCWSRKILRKKNYEREPYEKIYQTMCYDKPMAFFIIKNLGFVAFVTVFATMRKLWFTLL